MRRGTGAFTLVEILVAALLTTLLAGGVFSLLGGGNQLFTRGLQVAHGRQASLLFFETLEDDLAGCLIPPGHVGDPIAITPDGRGIAFYRTNRTASTLQITVASTIDWKLSGDPKEVDVDRNPVRNGITMKHVVVRDWKFSLVRPDHKKQKAWLLAVDAQFPEGGLTGRVVRVRRLIELVQPTSLARYGSPVFVSDVTPLSFVFLEAPEKTKKLLKTAGLEPGVGPAPADASKPASPKTTVAAAGAASSAKDVE